MAQYSVLVITPRFPLPRNSGTQIREYHALKELNRQFDVTLVSLLQQKEALEYISELETLGITVATVRHDRSRWDALLRFCISANSYRTCRFVTPSFCRCVRKVYQSQSFDLVWVNFATTVPVVPSSISAPIVVDEHNEDVRYWESFLSGDIPTRLFAHANIWKLRRFRRELRDRVDGFIAASAGDAERTREWVGETPVWTVPNGVDITEFDAGLPSDGVDEVVRFIGSLDVRMNTDALTWFANEIWPLIREQRSDAVFEIVGRNPSQKVQKLASISGVRVQGEVNNIVPWYESAALTVAPFRFGGGSKLKILESLSMRRPVVATSIGAVGLDVCEDTGVLIRERPDEFADGVIKLLANPSKRRRLGNSGREFVTKHYTWDKIMAEGINVVQSTLIE